MPRFDYWVNLMTLPAVFATEGDAIPVSARYLRADPTLVEAWTPKMSQAMGLKVGLVWAGESRHSGDTRRSIALTKFAPILDMKNVSFHLLQKGMAASEANLLPLSLQLTSLGEKFRHFGDTAAVISHLDLVITVDTAVAHLAGALGKPVWVLAKKLSDFRWLTGRDSTPWYPTARLFRQRWRGDWDEVIGRVKEALQEWVAAGGKAPELPKWEEAVLKPRVGLAPRRIRGLSAVTEARVGIVQYFPDDEPMGPSLEWYGEWLQEQLTLVLRWVRRDGVGMEVGAGVGAHAIALGEALGPEGHLFLYEGRPVVKRVLSQNLGANRIGNVTVMRQRLAGPGASEGTETLDELQLERLDWLKVNAGEAVQAILVGGEATLWRLRPLLLLGAANEAELNALAEQVKGYGYRCWRVETPLYDPANFNRRDDDIFGGRTALALVAIPEEINSHVVPSSLREA